MYWLAHNMGLAPPPQESAGRDILWTPKSNTFWAITKDEETLTREREEAAAAAAAAAIAEAAVVKCGSCDPSPPSESSPLSSHSVFADGGCPPGARLLSRAMHPAGDAPGAARC